MNNFFRALFILFALISGFSGDARAQRCDANYEAILKLRLPEVGAYNIWDTVYGEMDKIEAFVSGFTHENDNTIVGGERYVKGDKEVVLMLAEFDRRGRLVWEKEHVIAGLRDVKKLVPYKNGFIVLGNKNEKERVTVAWLGFFDFEGNLKDQNTLRSSGGKLFGHDLIPREAGSGYLMVAGAQENKPGGKTYTVFYRLNDRGRVISKRSFQPGLKNEILSLSPYKNGQYIASGYIYDAAERRVGWILMLEEDGRIAWQRQAPRGAGAQVEKALPYKNDTIVAIGNALPLVKSDPEAGWVLKLDARSGEIEWQRYLTGKYEYNARDLMVSADGLISVLLDGDPKKGLPANISMKAEDNGIDPDKRDYVRLLVFSPRGVILDSLHYFNGDGADAYQLIQGPSNERVMVGATDMVYTLEGAQGEEPVIKKSREGWALAVPAMDSYNDPCEADAR